MIRPADNQYPITEKETSMWREDDFQDNRKETKSVIEHKAGDLTNDTQPGAEDKADRLQERAQELSD
jgi:hypothetical protein